MKEAEIKQLDLKIQQELGINLEEYKNEEVIQTFVDMLVFPLYILNWVIRPVVIALVLYIVGFFVLDLVHVEYILYGLLGLVFFLLVGVLFGVVYLLKKMNTDFGGILNYSLDIMENSIRDVKGFSVQVTPENKRVKMNLLFFGIINIITLPLLSKAIDEKIPLIGGVIGSIVSSIVTKVTKKIDFQEDFLEKEELGQVAIAKDKSTFKSIDKTRGLLSSIISGSTRLVSLPFKVLFYIFLFLLIGFLYSIN